jgi:hypothetical protein
MHEIWPAGTLTGHRGPRLDKVRLLPYFSWQHQKGILLDIIADR